MHRPHETAEADIPTPTGLDAPCIPDTFVINVGDQFARWTSMFCFFCSLHLGAGLRSYLSDDIFVSTTHRVLPPTKPRYSIPFFFGCDHSVPLIPPPSCVSADRPNRYPQVVTAGAYVRQRLSETYQVSKA